MKLGVVQVFEGRRVFTNLTVEENLIAGGHIRPDLKLVREGIDRIYELFPAAEGTAFPAGRLSLGRRAADAGDRPGADVRSQGDASGRAVARPGAASLVEEIFGVIGRLKDDHGLTVLLVEQNAALALDIADHGYVMENGRIVLEGPSKVLRENSDIQEFYLGLNEEGSRKSYREAKHYRRRKRWLS